MTSETAKYLVYIFTPEEASGGWRDFEGYFLTLEEAQYRAKDKWNHGEAYQIVKESSNEFVVVEEGETGFGAGLQPFETCPECHSECAEQRWLVPNSGKILPEVRTPKNCHGCQNIFHETKENK